MYAMDWDILLSTELADKCLVAIRLLTTKTEIAMSRLNSVAKLFHYQQERHTIRTATQRHDI
jgi:hypothetical protein